MVIEVFVATGLVLTVKVAVVALAATITLAGTRAAPVSLLDSVTVAPPTGAGPFSLTVPVDGFPPTTELGLRLIEFNVATTTVKVVDRVAP